MLNVASDAHHWDTLDFNDLQNERRYRGLKVYGQSQLCTLASIDSHYPCNPVNPSVKDETRHVADQVVLAMREDYDTLGHRLCRK